MSTQYQGKLMSTLQDGKLDDDSQRFLTEVQAQFQSEELLGELRKRLDILNEIANNPELAGAAESLRDRLTAIFSGGGQEEEVLGKIRNLTEVQTPAGKKLDLRSFLKRERRTLSEGEYRGVLAKKLFNTRQHVVNLTAYYQDGAKELTQLSQQLNRLEEQAKNPAQSMSSVKQLEDKIRESTSFNTYESLKGKFLKDWIGRFAPVDQAQLDEMTPLQVQQLIQEHQRHQMTELLKMKIKQVDTDMSEHLGLHDTLEGDFREEGFWKGGNRAAKNGFNQWVLAVVQAFGMLKGQRYAFFQSENNPTFLLFGLGLPSLMSVQEETIRLVPYVKPFTKKGNYLLEIRQREIAEPDEYYHELRHYTLPFLFAFDQMKNFSVNKELVSFFTSKY